MPADFPTLTGPLWAKALQEARIRRAKRNAEIARMIRLINEHKKKPCKK